LYNRVPTTDAEQIVYKNVIYFEFECCLEQRQPVNLLLYELSTLHYSMYCLWCRAP